MSIATNRGARARRAAVLLTLLLSCLMPSVQAAPGAVVAIGGALRQDNDEIWQRLVALAGGPGARFAVFGTASDDPDGTAARIVEALERAGARAEVIRVAPRIPGLDLAAAVRDPRWVDRVRACQGVFFSGGDQERLMDTLRPQGQDTPLLAAVRELHARGGVVAGTSSGAAVMSEVAVRDIRSPLAVLQGQVLRDGVEMGIGFGFVERGIVTDQHFVKRGRIGRLLPLLAARGQRLGLGVDEDSAAVIQDGAMEVLGSRGVLVADLGDAQVDAIAPRPFAARGMRLSWLQRGDRMALATRTVTPSPQRAASPLRPNEPGFRAYHRGEAFVVDMLADGAIVGAMARVVDGERPELRGLAFDPLARDEGPTAALGFEWRVYRDAATHGWAGATGDEVTLVDVRVDVRPVRVARPLYGPWAP
jgi:cyanophycinase